MRPSTAFRKFVLRSYSAAARDLWSGPKPVLNSCSPGLVPETPPRLKASSPRSWSPLAVSKHQKWGGAAFDAFRAGARRLVVSATLAQQDHGG